MATSWLGIKSSGSLAPVRSQPKDSCRGLSHRAPSFEGFEPSSPGSSRAKKANRKTNTAHERELQRALRGVGLRFQTHRVDLPGKPDIVFPREKLAVFCDGDFWHGRHWLQLRRALLRRANAAYWVAKIGANRARDVRIGRALRREGWAVIRVWETDIRQDSESVASALHRRLESLRRRPEERGRAAQALSARTAAAALRMPLVR